ncbi:haloacid dehalogenase [Clostridium tetani]|uniref:Haloacid dehalogenase n=1 Tax=Clostridium tetani TaxID=1513 RepID=A0ABC8EAM6_CLOTA|nr:Cof-type HAD-IIB family hydrolase [Clostridium tetani]BDR79955.1 haloacid dehalogenase [Clostridium tetani]BDR88401.1 haloacid dehalogenase [Clostridium tetani]
MSYKLICIDIDGTLLRDDKKLSQRNINAIKAATKKGVHVAISTGRIFPSANYYAELIGVKSPVIASNGAYIKNSSEDKIIYEKTMEYEKTIKIINILKEYKLRPHFNTHNKILTESLEFSKKVYSKMNEVLSKNNKVDIELVDTWENALKIYEREILKAIIVDEDINKIKEVKEIVAREEGIEVVSSHNNNFEVMSKGISKGNAVNILADMLGIKKEKVMCIGDSENDLSMIKFAGLGVAMGNAAECIKEYADYITDTNNEDGVAKAIEKFII